MIFYARATRGRGLPSLDAHSGDHSQWLCLLQREISTSRGSCPIPQNDAACRGPWAGGCPMH